MSSVTDQPAVASVALMEALRHQRLVAYTDAVSATLFLYDYLLTFRLEVEFVWKSRWTFVKVLYIIQRYLPFLDTVVFVLRHQFARGLSLSYCAANYRLSGWCFTIGTAISETILALRLWAIWKNTVPVAIGLWIFYAICWIPDFVFMGLFLKSMRFSEPPAGIQIVGCFISAGSRILVACWALLMIFDTGSLLLMMVSGISAYRIGGTSELTRTVYREGILYYAYLFVLSLLNMTVILLVTPDLIHLLASFERVIHSVLTSRVLLHLRQVASRESAAMDQAFVEFNSFFGLSSLNQVD